MMFDVLKYLLVVVVLLLQSCGNESSPKTLDAPKNLVAIKGDAMVTLTWYKVNEATKYRVYYAKQSFSSIGNDLSNYATLDGGSLLQNITDNNKIIIGLTNGITYYFVVTAIKDDIEGPPSAMAGATPVSKPVLENLPAKHLTLGNDIEAFIFRNTESAASSCSSVPQLPSGLTMALVGGSCQISGIPNALQDATIYTVKALNLVGNSTATVSIDIALGKPRDFTATKGDTSVTLAWRAVSGATGYKIYYAQNAISASNLGSASLAQVSNVGGIIDNLINDTTYYFAVTAVKGGTESSLSAVISATPILSKPSIANLSTKQLIFNVNIEVFAFTNTGGLVRNCSSEPSLPSGLIMTLVDGSCQISGTPTTLQNTTTYTITATNVVGNDTATISISVNLDTPKNLTATKGNASVGLTWDAVSSATEYQVYYAKQSFNGISDLSNYASLDGGLLLENITSNSKTITGLAYNTEYYFVVTAVKNTFESGGSNEIIATPKGMLLNDTGMTWGGDYPLGNNTNCTGAVILEQDCSHGRDAKAIAGTLGKVGGGKAGFDFTKLGSTGNVLSIQNATWIIGGTGTESAGTKWSCVEDNHTGLIWEVKTDSGSKDSNTLDQVHTNIHHKDNRYRWGGKTALGRDSDNKEGAYDNNWTGLVDGTNAENLCGDNNWRVPTLEELHSIADLSVVSPIIDNHYFPNTVSLSFWSSLPSLYNSGLAWLLDFSSGNSGNYSRRNKFYVRLVRSKR
ncbi:DUF1566 domain-containing protein [Bathymodiolus thermophilus thioautotrophic gill symbiont]|nr:DUF1566 domain-containing protein [Bathymodiolus thermophilus thioautotrophic gill symbiont]